MIKVSPSILAADFANLKRDIDKVDNADMLHVDVMDGVFVPNISIGVPVVADIRKNSDMFIDLHLMIVKPQNYIEAFCKAGADLVVFHIESDCDVKSTIDLVLEQGKKVGVSVSPETDVEEVFPYVQDLDMVLVMTVKPGFGGQSFMPEMVAKVEKLRKYADSIGKDLDIEVDGGINKDNANLVVEAGANVLVAGSAVFNAKDPRAEVSLLQSM